MADGQSFLLSQVFHVLVEHAGNKAGTVRKTRRKSLADVFGHTAFFGVADKVNALGVFNKAGDRHKAGRALILGNGGNNLVQTGDNLLIRGLKAQPAP